MLNREQKAIDGTTPPDGVAVVRQRRDVAPHLGENAAHKKGHEAEVVVPSMSNDTAYLSLVPKP